MSQHIIIIGNPVDGFQFVGPFDNQHLAISHANQDAEIEGDWHVAPLDNAGIPKKFAVASWNADDIRKQCPAVDDESANDFLNEVEIELHEAMISAGWEYLSDAISKDEYLSKEQQS